MISIGIIEDLEDYRNLLQVLLEHTPDMQVDFAVSNAEDAITQIQQAGCPKVCIIDINLPGSSGIELVQWLSSHYINTLCLMCTAYDDSDKVFQSLEAGAHGYILKSTSPADIVDAVKELYNGGSPMSSEVSRKVVTAFAKKSNPALAVISQREKQILEMLSTGLLYKEIAAALQISIETVKRHCFNIYQKLHVNNRTEAINKFFGR